jgi:hypothetical protein
MGIQGCSMLRMYADMFWPVRTGYFRSGFPQSYAIPDREWECLFCCHIQNDRERRTMSVHYVFIKIYGQREPTLWLKWLSERIPWSILKFLNGFALLKQGEHLWKVRNVPDDHRWAQPVKWLTKCMLCWKVVED